MFMKTFSCFRQYGSNIRLFVHGAHSIAMFLWLVLSVVPTKLVNAWSASNPLDNHGRSHITSPAAGSGSASSSPSSSSSSSHQTALFLDGRNSGFNHALSSTQPSPQFAEPSFRIHAGSFVPPVSAAAAAAVPDTTSSTLFEQRMRKLVSRNPPEQDVPQRFNDENTLPSSLRTARKQRKRLPSNVVVVDSFAEYKRVVEEETQKVIAVRFHAHWCRACKAVEPLFYHMATKFPNEIFVDVPITEESTSLYQGFGISSLPFGHLYHPVAGLVEEIKMTRSFVPTFVHKLETYRNGWCELDYHGENEMQVVQRPYSKNA